MGNKAFFADEVRERTEELGKHGLDSALSVGLLTLSAYSSSARASMFCSHISQALIPKNPEVPRVATGYEYLFGKYSEGYKTIGKVTSNITDIDQTYKVIKKIEKYSGYKYVLLIQNDKTGEYDVIERNEIKNFAEIFGFKWNNDVIDSYKPGDHIGKYECYAKSPCFDDNNNFRYGVNANVIYITSQDTIEDAAVISESFAKKLTTTYVKECHVPMNDNDIFLNLYGDNDNYKSFPDIGEKTKNSILCGVRRKNKSLDQFNMRNNNLRKIFSDDSAYQFKDDYIVADIDIWSNKDIDDIPSVPAFRQAKKYLKLTRDFYSEVKDTLGYYIDNDEKCTPRLTQLYAKARDYLDPNARFSDDDRIFSNFIMDFTIYRFEKMTKGCKIAGRFGNKCVISRVLPDEEMGITEDGKKIDVRFDSLGVIGRLNTGQCIEQELNFIADAVVDMMKETKNIDEKLEYVQDFLDIASPEFAEYYKSKVEFMTKKEKQAEVDEIESQGIVMIESPMYCVTTEDLVTLYKKFQPKLKTVYFMDQYGKRQASLNKMVVGHEYILRLKQEPETKISQRSKALNNPRTSMPIKSTLAANNKKIFPDQANRLGEQEQQVLLLSGDNAALDDFFRVNSSSNEGRRSSELYTRNPSEGFEIDMPSNKSRSVEMFNAYFKSMGNALRIDYEKPQGDYREEDEIEIPNYIKKMIKDI